MFISFEGIEGSGKTSQIKHLAQKLKTAQKEFIVTKEPGDSRIGGKIRSMLLDPESNDLDPLSELLLYLADRAQHIKEVLLPALSEGKTVICDRYFDATVVYQGYARGIDVEMIEQLHHLLFNSLKPDITFLLDLPPEIGLARAWHEIKNGIRDKTETRFEKEALLFHQKIRAGYLELAQKEPYRFRIIDASKDENTVKKQIQKILIDSQ